MRRAQGRLRPRAVQSEVALSTTGNHSKPGAHSLTTPTVTAWVVLAVSLVVVGGCLTYGVQDAFLRTQGHRQQTCQQ